MSDIPPSFVALKDRFDVVLYHKNCHDGFTAFVVVYKYYKEKLGKSITGWACSYADVTIPDCTNMNILVLDFSFSLEAIRDLKIKAKSVFVLDHHISACKQLSEEPDCFFDMDRSGAMLAWDFFFVGVTPPALVSYVQDKDLWLWKLPGSRAFNLAIEPLALDITSWEDMMNDDTIIHALIQKNIDHMEYKTKLVTMMVNRAERFIWNPFGVEEKTFRVALVNTLIFINEVGEALYDSDDCDVAILYSYSITKKHYQFSLRSKKGSTDTNVISRFFGGGGHKNASGFLWTRPLEQFMLLLK